MRHMRAAGAAIAIAIAIGTSSCSSGTKPETTATPGATVPAYLACGAAAANLGEPTLLRDRIQLKITTVSHTQVSITAGYEISSPIVGLGLGFPIQPVPPTLVLIHDEAIAGVQPTVPGPLPPGTVNGRNVVIRPLPSRGKLTLTRLCPGLSWAGILRDRASYSVAIVMTRQPGPVRSASARFLSEAAAAI
jgi:hypothetical protein